MVGVELVAPLYSPHQRLVKSLQDHNAMLHTKEILQYSYMQYKCSFQVLVDTSYLILSFASYHENSSLTSCLKTLARLANNILYSQYKMLLRGILIIASLASCFFLVFSTERISWHINNVLNTELSRELSQDM